MQAPETETLDFEMEVTRTDNVKVEVTVSLTFPKGYGLTAAKAMEGMAREEMNHVYQQLIDARDAETLAAIYKNRGEDDDD